MMVGIIVFLLVAAIGWFALLWDGFNRHVLKRYLIDGISIERIAEEVDRSPRQTARIIKGGKIQLNKVLK